MVGILDALCAMYAKRYPLASECTKYLTDSEGTVPQMIPGPQMIPTKKQGMVWMVK